MSATRDQLLQMCPELRRGWQLWDAEMVRHGFDYRITCVSRFRKEQVALYSQGRDGYTTTNMYRKLAHMNPIPFDLNEYNEAVRLHPGKNKFVVTWTIDSPHVTDMEDAVEWNNLSRAFDYVLFGSNHKVTYELKTDVDLDGVSDWLEAAKLAKPSGLTAGAFFKDKKGNPNPDYPHMQVDIVRPLVA